MAKKSRVYGVWFRTAHEEPRIYGKPVPGMSKSHVLKEMNSQTMAVLQVKHIGWHDITLIGDWSGEYYFQLTSKKTGMSYDFESHDYGWDHLNLQFQKNVDDMIEEIEKANNCDDY